MNLVIKKLSKDMLDNYLHFFDDIAFCDNPTWSWCYCNHYHLLDKEIEVIKSKDESRTCLIKRINDEKHNGFMAFIDNEPVGWINTDKKENYARLMNDPQIAYDTDKTIASIVCFIVAKDYRGKGIATRLLNEAYTYYEKEGYDLVEAYPMSAPKNQAENYHGPLGMYMSNGFEILKDLDHIKIVTKQVNK